MSNQFKASIDITAGVAGVASVRELRQELERLSKLSQAGLPLTGEFAKLAASVAKVRPLLSSLSGSFSGLKAGEKAVRGVGTALGDLDARARSGFNGTTRAIAALISHLGQLTGAARNAAAALNSVASHQSAAWLSVNNSLATYITRAAAARAASIALATPTVVPAVRAQSTAGATAAVGGSTLLGVGAAGFAAKAGVGKMVDAGITVQGMQATLLAANNDNAAAAAKDFDYLVQQTDKWGLSLKGVGSEYARLKIAAMAAAKERGYSEAEGERAAKRQFEAISRVSTALHLQPEATKGMIKAFEQMQSKGKVSLEELTGQLGDRLPAAISLAATAAGVSTDKLFDMIKKKQLSSLEFVTLMSEAISKKYDSAAQKAAKGMQAQFNRVQNAITLSLNSMGSEGTFDVLASSAGKLADLLKDPQTQQAIKGFGLALAEAARGVVDFAVAAKQFYVEHKQLLSTVGAAIVDFGKLALAVKAVSGTIGIGTAAVAGLGASFATVGTAVGAMLRTLPLIGGFFGAVITKAAASAAAMRIFKASMLGAFAGYEVGQAWAARNNNSESASLTTESQIKQLKSVEAVEEKLAQLRKARKASGDIVALGEAKVNSTLGGTSWEAEKAKAIVRQRELDSKIKVAEARGEELKKKAKADVADAETEAKMLQDLLKKSQEKLVLPAEAKGNGKGSGTATVGAAELHTAKALYKERKTLLDAALDAELLSYADYAERLKTANEMLYQDSLDAAAKQVAGIKDKGARAAALAEKKDAIKAEFETTNAEIDAQLAERNRKMFDAEDNLRAEYAAKVGETVDAGYSRIDLRYKKLKAELLRNNREDGVRLVNELIAVEYADVRMNDLRQKFEKINLGRDARLTSIDIGVANGDMTGRRAEVEKLQIEKEYAAVRMQALEAEIAAAEKSGMTEKERLEYTKQAIELKKQMIAVTDTQRQLEEQAASTIADSIASLADSSVNSWEDAAKKIRSIYNKLVQDMLTEQIKQAMNQDKAKAGSSFLGGLLNSAIGGFMDFVGLGSGTPKAAIGTDATAAMSTVGSSVSPSWSAPALGDMLSTSSSSQSTVNTMNITLNTQADNPLNTSFLQQSAEAQRRMGLMAG